MLKHFGGGVHNIYAAAPLYIFIQCHKASVEISHIVSIHRGTVTPDTEMSPSLLRASTMSAVI